MCGSAQKGGINVDTIAQSQVACFTEPAFRRKEIYREKEKEEEPWDDSNC